MIDLLWQIGSVLAFIVGLVWYGGKRQRDKTEIEERNRAIATQQRIDHAKADLPITADDARKRLRDRAGR